ncbi:MAG TPA: hypothetical protein VJ506_02535 [Candidatus Limnocylindrales bacterium]|nr:hypothetical protein [Candidatus Limnocylindrales bacterium]
MITWDQFLERLQARWADSPTPEVIVFEIAVFAAAFLTYRFLAARIEHAGRHLVLIGIGMFLIEFFTGPMWGNHHLGFWAYVYSDVSWVLTLAWTVIISLSIYLVENVLRVRAALWRWLGFLLVITPVTVLGDALVKALGIRTYAPETIAAAGPATIPILDVPLAGLYYVPVVMTLVWAFYKHWLPLFEPTVAPQTRLPFLNRLVLTAIAVFLFEVVVEPMATNQNFPAWSYVFHDITVIMSGLWIAIVVGVTYAVDRLLPRTDIRLRFAAYLVVITAIGSVVEGWFLANGYRVYGPSATADFIGLRTLVGNIPIEVMAAIPMYLSLVIAFVRYWDGSVDHTLGFKGRSRTAIEAAPSVVPGRA